MWFIFWPFCLIGCFTPLSTAKTTVYSVCLALFCHLNLIEFHSMHIKSLLLVINVITHKKMDNFEMNISKGIVHS